MATSVLCAIKATSFMIRLVRSMSEELIAIPSDTDVIVPVDCVHKIHFGSYKSKLWERMYRKMWNRQYGTCWMLDLIWLGCVHALFFCRQSWNWTNLLQYIKFVDKKCECTICILTQTNTGTQKDTPAHNSQPVKSAASFTNTAKQTGKRLNTNE